MLPPPVIKQSTAAAVESTKKNLPRFGASVRESTVTAGDKWLVRPHTSKYTVPKIPAFIPTCGRFFKGDLKTLVNDFTKTFSILSPQRQKEAKARYGGMEERFKTMIEPTNAFLPFYMALVEFPEDDMNFDFREFAPQRYLCYLYVNIKMVPQFQCEKCSKIFRTHDAYHRHNIKKETKYELCTSYGHRYNNTPPQTTLSMDATTFMCNFGCSIVTEDKAEIIKHLIDNHTQGELDKWCMS